MRIWENFPAVAERIKSGHQKAELFGHHDYVHAFRVGEVARQIALEEWGDQQLSYLAGLAGLAHNADRILQKLKSSNQTVEELVRFWLHDVMMDETSRATVVEAVLKHSNKNSPDDSKVLVALMDGDRVVNLDTDLFIRSGQYYANLPVVDYQNFLDDPKATYRDPRSVMRDIRYSLDWVDSTSSVCVRTKKGSEMANTRAKVFSTFFDALRGQLAEEGIAVPFGQ